MSGIAGIRMEKLTQNRRMALNLVASLLSKGLVLTRQLFLVPLFLRHWGVDVYGNWLLITGIPSVLSMSNLGVGTAAGTQVGLATAREDHNQARLAFASGLAVTLFVGTFITALAGLSLRMWPGMGAAFPHLVRPELIALFLVASVALSMPYEVLTGVFTGSGKAAQAMQLQNIIELCRIVALITLVVLNKTPLITVVVDAILTGLGLFIFYWMAVTTNPHLRGWTHCLDMAMTRRLFTVGIGFQAGPLWQAILFQGSLWIANHFLGTAGTANWGTLRAVGRSMNQIFSLVNQTVYPEIQMALGRNDLAAARRLHGLGIGAGLVVAVILSAPLVVVGPYLYHFWTQGKLNAPSVVWLILGITAGLNSLWWTSGLIHRALNRPWYMNGIGVIAAIFSIGVMALLSRPLGIIGFAIGGAVFEAIMAATVMRRSLMMLEDDFSSMTRRVFASLQVMKYRIRKTRE